MAAVIPNVGDFGIPVASFAFGEIGSSTAVPFVVVQNLVLFTLGVSLRSKGRSDFGHFETAGTCSASRPCMRLNDTVGGIHGVRAFVTGVSSALRRYR